RRLLGDQNFTLSYGGAGRLRGVELLAARQTLSDTARPTAIAPGGAPTAAFEAFERHPPVPVNDRLAMALGSNSATLTQLFIAGLHQADPDVRAAATDTWLSAFESDVDLRTNVLSSLGGMDDAALTQVLRRM